MIDNRPLALRILEEDLQRRIRELEERIDYLLRANPLRCYDCGRLYAKGPDLIIDDDAWKAIAPHDGEGVLCPNCIHDRLVAAGFEDGSVRASFKSGPMGES